MTVRATTSHEQAARNALLAALRPFADEIGPQGMLAILAYTLGQMIALQNQRGMSPEVAMEIVRLNIECGNNAVIANLADAPGGHA